MTLFSGVTSVFPTGSGPLERHVCIIDAFIVLVGMVCGHYVCTTVFLRGSPCEQGTPSTAAPGSIKNT